MCLTTRSKQIPFDCGLVGVYRIIFVGACFPNRLGKRVVVTERNVSHTESERGKSVSESREAVGHVAAERARWQRFRYCFGIFLSALPGVTVAENRPGQAYSVCIPPASSLGDGAGRGEGRKRGMIDGFWKAFPRAGRVWWSLCASPANKALLSA